MRCHIEPDTLYVNQPESLLLKIERPQCTNLVVSFPCGEAAESLTTGERGRKLEPAAGNWKLHREEKEGILSFHFSRTGPKTSFEGDMWVLLPNVNVKCEGISYLTVEAESGTAVVPVKKLEAEPKVLWFEPVIGTVRKGEKALLCWETMGAEKCVLHPGGIEAEPSGSVEIEPEETAFYCLEAYGHGKTAEKSAYVYLYEDELEEFIVAEPDTYYMGSRTELWYKIAAHDEGRLKIKGRETVDTGDFITESPISVWACERFIFSYRKGGKDVERYLHLKPDPVQVILQFTVAFVPGESHESYAVKWDTFGAKEIQVFVRVYKSEAAEDGIHRFYSKALASEEETWETVYQSQETEKAVYYFILRAKNLRGEWKEAAAVYQDGQEVMRYDNLPD